MAHQIQLLILNFLSLKCGNFFLWVESSKDASALWTDFVFFSPLQLRIWCNLLNISAYKWLQKPFRLSCIVGKICWRGWFSCLLASEKGYFRFQFARWFGREQSKNISTITILFFNLLGILLVSSWSINSVQCLELFFQNTQTLNVQQGSGYGLFCNLTPNCFQLQIELEIWLSKIRRWRANVPRDVTYCCVVFWSFLEKLSNWLHDFWSALLEKKHFSAHEFFFQSHQCYSVISRFFLIIFCGNIIGPFHRSVFFFNV